MRRIKNHLAEGKIVSGREIEELEAKKLLEEGKERQGIQAKRKGGMVKSSRGRTK